MSPPANRLVTSVAAFLRGDTSPLSATARFRAIDVARISLIVGLVFLHYGTFPNSHVSPRAGLDPTGHHLATYINSFVLYFFYSAVPLLSMISGFLFFTGISDARQGITYRIKRRFTSLYMPLVLWNSLYLGALLLVAAYAPDYHPLTKLNLDLPHAGILQYINAISAVTGHPLAFQFWFVRDLFVTVLISPVLWLMLRKIPLIGACTLGIAWLTGHSLWIFFRLDVPLFFYLGALLCISGFRVEIGRRATIALVSMYLLVVALRAFAPYLHDSSSQLSHSLAVATNAMRIIGVVACWGLILRIADTRAGQVLLRFSPLAFFVFAFHFPLLSLMKIVLWPLLPATTDGWMLAHYLASVSFTILAGIALGMVLSRHLPQVFALLNGGRSFRWGSRRRADEPGHASRPSSPS